MTNQEFDPIFHPLIDEVDYVPTYNPQWEAYMKVDKPLFALMSQHDFSPYHTGGGCMSWERENAADGSQLLIGNECELGRWHDCEKPEWIVGRYDQAGGFIEVYLLTLAQALELAPKLPAPSPAGEQECYTLGEYEALEANI